MPREFTASSGAKVTIHLAPFERVMALKNLVLNKKSELIMTIDEIGPEMLAAMIDSEPDISAAVWPLLISCLRNGQKIVPSTFDDAESRKDYLQIVGECVKENLSPLFVGLSLKLKEMGDARNTKDSDTPK